MKVENLTDCEEVVMKGVWDFDKEPVLSEIVAHVNKVYGREWAPQTVSTYLAKLCRKGYLELKRNGKIYTYKILVKEKVYRRKLYREHISFWNNNDVKQFISEMIANGDLKEETLKSLISK
ncbi:MAG: BlaI/MecI/CopY family transcriptional regulator [Lachnospiraceae bacterium]|nr:BlaI/MecI/CopY family transcriptional regulator [Lachnospiraceae bacterium]